MLAWQAGATTSSNFAIALLQPQLLSVLPQVQGQPALSLASVVCHEHALQCKDICRDPLDTGGSNAWAPGGMKTWTTEAEAIKESISSFPRHQQGRPAGQTHLDCSGNGRPTHHGVVVAVDHERPSAPQVDIFFPPVTHLRHKHKSGY